VQHHLDVPDDRLHILQTAVANKPCSRRTNKIEPSTTALRYSGGGREGRAALSDSHLSSSDALLLPPRFSF
jgi:hypothetical protein